MTTIITNIVTITICPQAAWCTRAGCHCGIAAPSRLWARPAQWAPQVAERRGPGREGCNRPATEAQSIDEIHVEHGNFNHHKLGE